MSESTFFQDLAVLMTVAGLVSVVFGKLRWPKVIGYIGAGVLLGPHTWGGAWLADEQSVKTIGQLGVVFLMFAMGLGFSTSQMRRIKSVAAPVALLDTLAMTGIGYAIGRYALGWDSIPSLFLGAAICDSATTMLAKVIDEMGWGDRPFVKFALGSSVFEDILCVGIIAVITGVARGEGLSVSAAGTSLGGLFVFFLVAIVVGFVLVPRLLKSVAKARDDEALLLTILGVCFFISWVAFKFDFSLALGAFLVGILGASSEVRFKLAALVDPLKSMFASVFFVSVGLLFDPSSLLHNGLLVLALSAVVVGGKFLNCTVGAIAAGERVGTAVRVGLSLAQIGEFAFMVAMLYIDATGDTESSMFDIVVAVSLLTTLLNPLLIRAAGPFGDWMEAHQPAFLRRRLESYRALVARCCVAGVVSPVRRDARAGLVQLGVIAVLNLAAAIVASILVARDWSGFSHFLEDHKVFVVCLALNLLCVALLVPATTAARTLGAALARILADGAGVRPILCGIVRLGVPAAAVVLLLCQITKLNNDFGLVPDDAWARNTINALLLAAAVFGWRLFEKGGKRALARFGEALTAEERQTELGRLLSSVERDGSIHRLTLGERSPAVGATAVTLNVRSKTGATIISVLRNGEMIRFVGGDLEFRIGDTLLVAGTGAQVAALKDLLGIIQEDDEGGVP